MTAKEKPANATHWSGGARWPNRPGSATTVQRVEGARPKPISTRVFKLSNDLESQKSFEDIVGFYLNS